MLKMSWTYINKQYEAAVPPPISCLVEVLGFERTVAFLMTHGGNRLYIGSIRSHAGSNIATFFSQDESRALHQKLADCGYPNEFFTVPIARPFLCRYFKSQGMIIAHIAREVRVAEWTVRRFLTRTDYHGGISSHGRAKRMGAL